MRAPNARAHAERWVGSVRRECLDRILIVGRRHLHHVLATYTRITTNTGHTARSRSNLPTNSQRRPSPPPAQRIEEGHAGPRTGPPGCRTSRARGQSRRAGATRQQRFDGCGAHRRPSRANPRARIRRGDPARVWLASRRHTVSGTPSSRRSGSAARRRPDRPGSGPNVLGDRLGEHHRVDGETGLPPVDCGRQHVVRSIAAMVAAAWRPRAAPRRAGTRACAPCCRRRARRLVLALDPQLHRRGTAGPDALDRRRKRPSGR